MLCYILESQFISGKAIPGTRFWCQAIVTPLFDESKQVRSFARVMHDLTESEGMQAQRKRADGLAEANRTARRLRLPPSPGPPPLYTLRSKGAGANLFLVSSNWSFLNLDLTLTLNLLNV